jgi:hypothetical protein
VGPALRTVVIVASPQLGRQMPSPEDRPVGYVGDADRRCESEARDGVLVDQRSRYDAEAAELLDERAERVTGQVAGAEPGAPRQIEPAVTVVAEPLGVMAVVMDTRVGIVGGDRAGREVGQLGGVVRRRRETQRPSSLAARRAIRATSAGSLPAASHSSGDMPSSA